MTEEQEAALKAELDRGAKRLRDGLAARKLGHFSGAVDMAEVCIFALVTIAARLAK